MQALPVKSYLLWSLAINYLILCVWFLVFILARDRLYALHTRWFAMSRELFNALHYSGMGIYKLGILLWNLTPLLALLLGGE